jgi:RluA family pseudouridine synthase
MKKLKLDICYQDDDLILLNKPAGVLSVPDRYDTNKPNLKHILGESMGDIFAVHRLDRDTSGLICYARNAAAHSYLSQQFSDRTVTKEYLALVEGRVADDAGDIDRFLIENPAKPGRMMVAKKGLVAHTSYEVHERFKDFTLLKVMITTGRTHQIRVHLQSIGHPLVADPFYGRRSEFFLSTVKGKKYQQNRKSMERPLLSRTALHAYRLRIQHPVSGEILQQEAPFPKDMHASLQQLRKWNALG